MREEFEKLIPKKSSLDRYDDTGKYSNPFIQEDWEIVKSMCKWQKKQDINICKELMENNKSDFAEGCRRCMNEIEEQDA